MYHIYKFTFPNGKVYIGRTCGYQNRLRNHKYMAFTKNHKNKLYNAIREYGWDSIDKSIIYSSDNKVHTEEVMEDKFIREYDSINNGYNTLRGGSLSYGLRGNKNPAFSRAGLPMSSWASNTTIQNHKKAMSARHSGIGNAHAKKWLLISPDGVEYRVHGKLQLFCEDHQLSFGKIYNSRNIGRIPTLSPKTRRATQKSKNCVGWEVKQLD